MRELLLRSTLVGWLLVMAVVTAAASEPGAEDQPAEPQTPRFTGQTEVVASRIAGEPATSGRKEVILTREEIAALPVQTLQDVLAILPGLGLNRRGARGVQGDLNLRGGTFEQVAVLVNGIRVNNPQTGHHHLDLFLPAAAIERVEVLLGPGSAVHGPDAFGGAINIVTGPPPAAAFLRLGSHHLTGGGLAGALGNGLWGAVEREVHTGFRDDTEAWVNQAAGGWSQRRGDAVYKLTVAAGERKLGAWSFYSSAFPNQREETGGELLTFSVRQPLGAVGLALALRLDRHRDLFVLDRARPEWYRNRHRTRGGLVDLVLSGELAGWGWAAGVEAARDEIDSSNLGRHHQVRSAAFLELARSSDTVSGGLQLRLDHHRSWGWVSAVAAGGSWQVADGWQLRMHYGESFRTPSFTELYYTSPATVGNPGLEPEQGWTGEIGLDSDTWSLTLFQRRADPIIDYVLDDDQVWRADNLGRVTTRGVETGLLLPSAGPLQWQRISLVYLDSTIDVDTRRSAYALAHPRLEAAWTGALEIAPGWQAGWAVRMRDPSDGGSWSAVDLRVMHTMREQLSLSLAASNLFDRDITELHGIPLPGRWLSLTIRYGQSR
jgi:iron complex outermembrane receptor protein